MSCKRRHERRNAVNRLLKERAVAEQFDELLGRFLAAYRPETLAASPGHDDDKTVFDVGFCFRAHNFLTADGRR